MPQAKSRARLWLLPLFALGGVAAAIGLLLALAPEQARSASEVRSEISELVLRKSDLPNATDGGAIGPWWVSATDGDPQRGEFRDFLLKSGSMQVAAKTARLVIEPELGTFHFELRDVVVMRVPEDGEEASVIHLDRYALGPAPLRGRVVRDDPMARVVRARD